MQQKMVKEVNSVVHLDTLEAGLDYCVKAQAYVEVINRSSSFSQTQCVRAQGNSLPSFSLGAAVTEMDTPATPPFISTQYLLPCARHAAHLLLGGGKKGRLGSEAPYPGMCICPWSVPAKDLIRVGGKSSHRGCRLTALSSLYLQSL